MGTDMQTPHTIGRHRDPAVVRRQGLPPLAAALLALGALVVVAVIIWRVVG